MQEDGDTLVLAYTGDGNYRGAYSVNDLPGDGNTPGDVALVSTAYSHGFHRWITGGGNPHWARDEPPVGYLGGFGSEYAASRHVSEVGQYAVFVSREHTWTGLSAGTYQVRVAAVGDGARSGQGGCHNGQHFHDDGRGFWSHARVVEVGSSQAPGKVTNPSMERAGGRVTITWDQPSSDNSSVSWAMIRYRPVGSDPDAYDYTYIPGVPDPTLLGQQFHEVPRICDVTGDDWILSSTSASEGTDVRVQTCTNPRKVVFTVGKGKLYEVGIAAINANGVSAWHNFDHFWHGPR